FVEDSGVLRRAGLPELPGGNEVGFCLRQLAGNSASVSQVPASVTLDTVAPQVPTGGERRDVAGELCQLHRKVHVFGRYLRAFSADPLAQRPAAVFPRSFYEDAPVGRGLLLQIRPQALCLSPGLADPNSAQGAGQVVNGRLLRHTPHNRGPVFDLATLDYRWFDRRA